MVITILNDYFYFEFINVELIKFDEIIQSFMFVKVEYLRFNFKRYKFNNLVV